MINQPESENENLQQPSDTNEQISQMLDELFGKDDEKVDNEMPVTVVKRVKRPKKFLKVLLSLLLVICIIVGTVAAVLSYNKFIVPDAYDKSVAHSRDLYSSKGDFDMPLEYLPEFGALYNENKNIMGWLSIKGTGINHPVMMYKTDDYYKDHLFNNRSNKYGTLYFASNYKQFEYNANTVIYGNNFSDSRAFGDLVNYTSADFVEKNPIIQMNTLMEKVTWKIFAVIEYDENKYNPAKNSFYDYEEFSQFVADIEDYTLIKTSVDVNEEDVLLTLITDHNSKNGNKLAVFARALRFYEREEDEVFAHFNDVAQVPSQPQSTTDEQKLSVNATVQQSAADTTAQNTTVITSEATLSTTKTTALFSDTTAITTTKPTTTKSTTTKPTTTKPTTTKPTTAKPTTTAPTTTVKPSGNVKKIRVKDSSTGKIYYEDAPIIIAKIIEAEMGSSYELEALKAQAVAAYTYMLYSGAADGSAPSAPMKTAGNRAIQAANAVAGQTITYNGSLCNAVYFATSAGKTANCNEVWVADLPYLRSVDSAVDESISGFKSTRTYTASNVASWVKSEYGVDLTKVKDKTKWFSCTYDANKLYVKTVSLGGLKSVKGIDLRYDLFTSSRTGSSNVLRSHAFTVTYNSSNDSFTFNVKGFGHGVGLSQTGANQYAKKGWSYDEILKHYYKGVTLS